MFCNATYQSTNILLKIQDNVATFFPTLTPEMSKPDRAVGALCMDDDESRLAVALGANLGVFKYLSFSASDR